MRLHVLSAALSMLLVACGLPPNTPQATGAVAYDRSTGDFWVSGKPYVLPPDVVTHGVRSGDRVNVFYRQEGDQRIVTRIEVVERLFLRVL